MVTVWVSIPVNLENRPDNTLPPSGSGGTPENPIVIPPEVWPTPPGGGAPTHPIYVPIYPDQGLPGDQPRPDQGLPPSGSGGTPDQGLPGSQPEPTHPIAPIYVPIYPA